MASLQSFRSIWALQLLLRASQRWSGGGLHREYAWTHYFMEQQLQHGEGQTIKHNRNRERCTHLLTEGRIFRPLRPQPLEYSAAYINVWWGEAALKDPSCFTTFDGQTEGCSYSKENCSTYKTPDLFPGSEESQLTLFVVTHNCYNGGRVISGPSVSPGAELERVRSTSRETSLTRFPFNTSILWTKLHTFTHLAPDSYLQFKMSCN